MHRVAIAWFIVLLAAVPMTATASASAFDQAAFERAQAAGRTIVVESFADWCPPCRIQAPILARLQSQKRYRDLPIFDVGETTPPDVWKRFGLVGYGTLVVFRGEREVARGIPITKAAIVELLRSAK